MPAPIPPLFSSNRQNSTSVLQANGGDPSTLTPSLFALQAEQFLNASFAKILSDEEDSDSSSSFLGGSGDPFTGSNSLFGNLAGLTGAGSGSLTSGLSSLLPASQLNVSELGSLSQLIGFTVTAADSTTGAAVTGKVKNISITAFQPMIVFENGVLAFPNTITKIERGES